MLAQSFSEALSGAGGNAQEAGRSAAVAAATAFAQSGGDNAVAIAFSQAIVTNGNTVAAAFSLAVAISIGDFNFRCAACCCCCCCCCRAGNMLGTQTPIASGSQPREVHCTFQPLLTACPPPCPPPCSLAISNAIVAGGCTPATANLLATAQATAIAQGNGGKFQAVAQASAAASCLPGVGRRL